MLDEQSAARLLLEKLGKKFRHAKIGNVRHAFQPIAIHRERAVIGEKLGGKRTRAGTRMSFAGGIDPIDVVKRRTRANRHSILTLNSRILIGKICFDVLICKMLDRRTVGVEIIDVGEEKLAEVGIECRPIVHLYIDIVPVSRCPRRTCILIPCAL